MHLAPRRTSEPDSRAATQSAASDRAAFADLYEENFDGLFDFVVRVVRDRDMAADVVQATFARAWDEIRLHRELRHPKAWLYATARNRAIDELRRRRRIAPEPPEYAQPDPSRLADPQAVAEDKEMVDLVWSSAAALSPAEYSLLDLHIRRGLGAAELSEALELERGAVYTRLSRLRNSLEESVASTLLVRRGREDCEELAAIAGDGSGESLTPELRRAVREHVKECETCSRARRRFVAPLELFGALVPIAALPGVRESIWQSLPANVGASAGAGAAATAQGGASARRGLKASHGAAGALVVAAALAIAVLASGGPSVRDPERASSPDHAIAVASADPTVTVRWSPGRDATGYSVIFSRDRAVEPPATVNVTGTEFTSAPLAPGRWWFILRTRGSDGRWTDTLRLGPFVIAAPARTAALPAPRAGHRNHGTAAADLLALRTVPPVSAATSTAAQSRRRSAAPRGHSPRRSHPPRHSPPSGPRSPPVAPPTPAPFAQPPVLISPPAPQSVPAAGAPAAPEVGPPRTTNPPDGDGHDDDDRDEEDHEGGKRD